MDIRERIKKLLAMANDSGASDNEKSMAMRKAEAMIEEHNIELASLADTDEITIHKSDTVSFKTTKNFHRVCASAAAYLYGARVINHTRGKNTAWSFWGAEHMTIAAEETFFWLVAQIDASYKQRLKEYGGKLTASERADLRASFKDNCAQVVWERIWDIVEERKTERAKDSRALVVVDTIAEKLDEAFAEEGIRPGRKITIKDGIGSLSGRAAGRNIQIQRGVRA